VSASLARRIAKLEPRAIPKPVPHVAIVPHGSTAADAIAAFKRRHAAKLKPYHALIIVPDRIGTAEQEADFKARFLAHQTRIVAEARSSRPKEQADG
jgi:hypothetical protein